jgi:large subunit ribosomal protein L21
MYAVVRTGGKQYRVKEGDLLRVEKLDGGPGDKVTLAEVLLVGTGPDVKVGRPHVDGAAVEAQIVRQTRGPKVLRYRTQEEGWTRVRGHRQQLTELKITAIKG